MNFPRTFFFFKGEPIPLVSRNTHFAESGLVFLLVFGGRARASLCRGCFQTFVVLVATFRRPADNVLCGRSVYSRAAHS